MGLDRGRKKRSKGQRFHSISVKRTRATPDSRGNPVRRDFDSQGGVRHGIEPASNPTQPVKLANALLVCSGATQRKSPYDFLLPWWCPRESFPARIASAR